MDTTSRALVIVLCISLLAVPVAGLAGVAGAQDVPGTPVSFYGDITDEDGGTPGDAIDVVAVDTANGEELNRLEADADGSLGGPDLGDDKLVVGEDQPVGDVTFHLESSDGLQVVDIQTDDITVVDGGQAVDLGDRDGDIHEVELVFETLDDELAAIDLELDDTTLEEGETTGVTVTAQFGDGTDADVTDDATIESDDEAIATVDDGTITAESEGTVDITAEYTEDGVTESDEIELEVQDDDTGDNGASNGGNGGNGGGGNGAAPGGGGGGAVGPSVSLSESIADADPGTPGTTITFDQSAVESVTLSDEDAEGTIEVEEYSDLPSGAPDTGDRPVMQSVVIGVSDAHADAPATIRMTVDQTELLREDVGPEELAVLKETAGGYETLETSVVDANGDVTLEAETPGFSTFIVSTDEGDISADEAATDPDEEEEATAPDEEDAQPANGEDTQADGQPADEEESDGGIIEDMPGFGVPVTLAALLAAALLAARRKTMR